MTAKSLGRAVPGLIASPATVQREETVPWYGRYEGRSQRGADIHVAELPWSPALARQAVADGAMLLHTGAPGSPVCSGG